MEEVDLETVAGNVADSLSQIFLLTPRPEVRRRAYEIMGASSAREFAARVEYHINAYLQLGTESNDQRSILDIRKERDAARAMMRTIIEQKGPQAIAELCREEMSNGIDAIGHKNTTTRISPSDFSDEPKTSKSEFSEDELLSGNERIAASCSQIDFSNNRQHNICSSKTGMMQRVPSLDSAEWSSYGGEESARRYSKRECSGEDKLLKKKPSSSSTEFTSDSPKEFSKHLESTDGEFSKNGEYSVDERHGHISSNTEFSSDEENIATFRKTESPQKVPSIEDAEFSPREHSYFAEGYVKKKRFCMKLPIKSPRRLRVNTREEYHMRGHSDMDTSSSDDEFVAEHSKKYDGERLSKDKGDSNGICADRSVKKFDDESCDNTNAQSMGRCMSSSSYEHLANGIAAVVLTESEQFSDVSNQSSIFQGIPNSEKYENPPTQMDIASTGEFSRSESNDSLKDCDDNDDIKKVVVDSEDGEFSDIMDIDDQVMCDDTSLLPDGFVWKTS